MNKCAVSNFYFEIPPLPHHDGNKIFSHCLLPIPSWAHFGAKPRPLCCASIKAQYLQDRHMTAQSSPMWGLTPIVIHSMGIRTPMEQALD